MKPIEVTEIIRQVESGMTEPYQCRLDDGNLYAVKGRNATTFGLIAEVVSARLGTEVGLPIPHFELCKIPNDLLTSVSDPNVLSSLGKGVCFASHWIQPTDIFSLAMGTKVGDIALAEIYVFDHWIENGDRTLTPLGGNVNLLLSLSTETLVAFDHNMAFSDTHKSEDLKLHVGRTSWHRAKDIVGFRDELRARLITTKSKVGAFFDDLPDEWLDENIAYRERIRASLERVETEQFWNELG